MFTCHQKEHWHNNLVTKKEKTRKRDRIKNALTFFISPAFLGILITLTTIWAAMEFYATREMPEDSSLLNRYIRKAHEFSYDLRLKNRGKKPVSASGQDSTIVLLTIDERSLEQEGRWPWPRGKIAKILDRMFELEASVIGFDIIFAEQDRNAAVLSLENLKQNPEIPTNLYPVIDKAITQANTDNDLANAIKRHGDKIVIGSYFDKHPKNKFLIPGYVNLCLDHFFKTRHSWSAWEKIAEPLLPTDQMSGLFEDEMPELWANILDNYTPELEDKARKSFYKDFGLSADSPIAKTLELQLEERIVNEKRQYCDSWLVPKDKSNKMASYDHLFEEYRKAWPQIKEDYELPFASFEETVIALKETQKTNPIEIAGKWWLNYNEIAMNAKHRGYFNALQDRDGTIRKTYLVVRSGNQYFPSLALKTYLLHKKYNAGFTLGPDPISPLRKKITDFSILKEGEPVSQVPVNGQGYMLINYAGPQRMFPHISVADILNDDPYLTVKQWVYNEKTQSWGDGAKEDIRVKKTDFIKNKIFLFGATATGIYDLRVTPFDENFPGLETHANVVQNLLAGNYLREHNDELQMIVFLLVYGVIISFVIGHFGAAYGLIISLALSLIIYLLDRFYLFGQGLVIPIIFPFFLTGGIYLILTIYKYFTEEQNKKVLKATFEKYVSPAIVAEVLAAPGNIELGGRKEHMTVLFSDIRGFTTISEKLDPRALSDLLNSYLPPMTDLVFEHRGTLDKYMGDAIMAFFGAPIHYPDHAAFGCRCALAQLKKLGELQIEYKKNGLPHIDIGLGLNTGDMSVGNMGSETVRSYTVMGDSVNLGSRLEGINKQYGTRIIISEFTQKEVADDFYTREIDWVRVKGKIEPVRIFELVGEKSKENEIDSTRLKTVEIFSEGFKFYHDMNWDKANLNFTKALNLNPEDGCSKLYLKRCQDYIASPPSKDWDGVFVMTTK